MNRYKSWSGLNKQLTGLLCANLKGRVTYFLTRYHDVHNAYGRAAVRCGGKELVTFSWAEAYRQDGDLYDRWKQTGEWDAGALKDKWDADRTYCDMDFLSAASEYINMPIADALRSDNYIVRMFAVMDRRVRKRTVQKLSEEGGYEHLPQWLRQFYELRFKAEGIRPGE